MPINDTVDSRIKNNQTTTVVDLKEHGQILAVHCSMFEWSQDIILLAFPNKIILAQINTEKENIEFQKIEEFIHNYRCHSLTISPETTLSALPRVVAFCTADNDFKIRMFKSNLDDNNPCHVIAGHSNYINDINFDPEDNFLASVSDDHTARLWDTNDYKSVTVFHLSSPGIATCWHREDSAKLMVAEKIGLIRFYNVQTHQPIMSLDYGKSIASAHWAPSDSQLVGSLQQGELILWDMTRPSRPSHTKLLYSEGGGNIKFSPQSELVATMNCLEGCVKIIHIGSQQQRLSFPIVIPTNLSWHFRLPILCIGDDTKLIFSKVIAK